MRTALRKMGNSAGMIVPRAIIAELGSAIGEDFEISVEDGRIVAIPVRAHPRAGWEEDAAAIASYSDREVEDWQALDGETPEDWTW